MVDEVKKPIKRKRKSTVTKAKAKVAETKVARPTKREVTIDPKTKVKVTRLPSGLVVTSK